MKYNKESDRIELSVSELVWFARRRTAVTYHDTSEERDLSGVDSATRMLLTGQVAPETLTFDCSLGEYRFRIFAEADLIDEREVVLIRRTPGHAGRLSRDSLAQARGEFYCVAYILTETTGAQPRGVIHYIGEGDPVPYSVSEEPSRAQLKKFFDKLLTSAAAHAAPEMERVVHRLPAIAHARFPYGEMREGQRELIETVYTTIRRGGRLYASAPTGIGKTIATLYPALRALGEGRCEKIFYLTPKNTAGVAAAEACRRLAEAGVPVRCVMLTAKETICPHRMICRQREKCGLSPIAAEREDDAARALLARGAAVITSHEIAEEALAHKVCPYELSLRYSQYADVVICDYNYLFDPRVALKRFFLRGGNYAFLVDEAHNLVERARHIWTKQVSDDDIDRLIGATEYLPTLRAAAVAFKEKLMEIVTDGTASEEREDADGVKRGFYASQELPEAYYMALSTLVYACEDALMSPMSVELARRVRPMCYDLRDVLDRLGDYDERFTTFLLRDGDSMQIRTVCLDPAGVVNERLLRGGSAVLFSATLTPITYYRDVLGGRRGDTVLEVASPFDENNLCIAVMDRISTRYLEREDTVRQVVKAILTCVKAKPGNYMVFCPSYHYMIRLHEALHTAVPKLNTLVQKKDMTKAERAAFLAAFDENPKSALVGFCVMGGIYSEGVDLVGKRLIGAVIVGVGLPGLSDEREAMRAYFDETQESGRAYAYVMPGMNRVLQAAGRVIRTETDRGVVLLIDDRFSSPEYRHLIPEHWQGLSFVGDHGSLSHLLDRFWRGEK